MKSYAFVTVEYRAQCLRVIDGDTAILFVDRGNYDYSQWKMRLYGVDTPELRSKNADERMRAQDAKAQVATWLPTPAVINMIALDRWPLRIRTYRDPDSFGRLLCEVYWMGDDNVEHHVNAELLSMGLAVPFKP
jgi:micrococcal nuclease